MKVNHVREKIKGDMLSMDCCLGLGNLNGVDLLGHVNDEWLLIEIEHNRRDSSETGQMRVTLGNAPVVPIDSRYDHIKALIKETKLCRRVVWSGN